MERPECPRCEELLKQNRQLETDLKFVKEKSLEMFENFEKKMKKLGKRIDVLKENATLFQTRDH